MSLYKYAEIYYKQASYHSWDWSIWSEICKDMFDKYSNKTTIDFEDVKKDTLKINHNMKKLEYFILDELIDKYEFPKKVFDNIFSDISSVRDIASTILNNNSVENFKIRLGMIFDYVERIRKTLDRLYIPSYYKDENVRQYFDSDKVKNTDDKYFFWQGKEFEKKNGVNYDSRI